MFILLPVIFLFLTALALLILRWLRPGFAYAWLVVASGACFPSRCFISAIISNVTAWGRCSTSCLATLS
ncbi:MAG: hypothetical protein C0393_00980 [Anaerolinea sp.]|nr:hypothetical protein [Anaerolinea sp.]